MPPAKLLLRQSNVDSLSSVVERSQLQKPPYAEFDLRLTSAQLDIVLTSKPPVPPRPYPPQKQAAVHQPSAADEGFESDVDSLSIISSDDNSSTTGGTGPGGGAASPKAETDSANGSSDSDTEPTPSAVATATAEAPKTPAKHFETHNLVDCVCYKDIKFPNVLVFVIKRETLVFQFDSVDTLDAFYATFTTFKAVTNQKTYSKTLGGSNKFNLLHRTDNNGITHIEIAREPETQIIIPDARDSSIISINAPDSDASGTLRTAKGAERRLKNTPRSAYGSYSSLTLKPSYESRQLSESARYNTIAPSGPKSLPSFALKSASTENLLELTEFPKSKSKSVFYDQAPSVDRVQSDENVLRKVWKSAEDLLDAPARPARRRKPKGKAPAPPAPTPPPTQLQAPPSEPKFAKANPESKREKHNALKALAPRLQTLTNKTWNLLPHTHKAPPTIVLTTKPQIHSYQHQFPEQKLPMYYTDSRQQQQHHHHQQDSWTNSVPRMLRKPRSRSETRNFTPMAYRYIDTTNHNPMPSSPQSSIGNRLFGLSQKLKDFGPASMMGGGDGYACGRESRRSSYDGYRTIGGGESTLKSVIKKQDDSNKKPTKGNDKKVTFSAYTTVQVV